MRPIKLTLNGLRSYRSPVTIDFTDAGLVAIVGDTGSGKSSILEGLTYALYNASTWSGKDVRELIADGVTVMNVDLEFEADGERYEITRATSRSNYPPAVHRLRCLSDAKRPDVDGVDGVKTEVHRLVGLTYDAFLSAVILPQGKFQSLLQAKRGDRVDILKGIFRLDIVETARGEAQGAHARLDTALREREVERARLLDDPGRTAREREKEAREAAKAEKHLAAIAKVIEAHGKARAEAETSRMVLTGPRDALDESPAGVSDRIRVLLPRANELAKQRKAIETQRAALDREIDALKKTLEGLEKKGEGPAALAEALHVIERVDRDESRVAERRSVLETEEADLTKDEVALKKSAQGLKAMETAARNAEVNAADREAAAKQAEVNVERAGALLERALEIEETAAQADRDAAALRNRLATTIKSLDSADARVAGATRDREAAENALAALQRQHAAAHAAEGVAAGDDCPICARPLPKGFKPPSATGEAGVKAALSRAAAAEKKTADDANAIRTERAVLEREMEQWNAGQELRAKEIADRRKALAVLVPAAKTGTLSEALLETLAAKLAAARKTAEAATAAARRAGDAWVTARASLEPQRKALAERRLRLDREIKALAAAEADSIKAVLGLPKCLGLKKTTALAERAAARRELERRRDAVAGDAARLETYRDAARGFDKERVDVEAAWAAEIEGPMRAMERDLGHLHQRVNDAAKALGGKPEAVADAKTLEERAGWAEKIESRRRDLLKQLEEKLEAERKKIEAAEAEVAAALRTAGFEAMEALDAARIEIRAVLKTAEKEAEMARAQVDQARSLDRQLRTGQELRGALKELATALADGKFVAHVIERRQKELLGVATGILDGMTGGRYGFSGDFQVVDLDSGQPRSTKTLSGGESFLASLALALALVEIAGRSGGRLDALFLDEGFGALDANALDEALSALENRAGDGRLVAVVSHLKAVAERIERVLYVTKTPSGSAARWVSGRERDDIVDREIEAGLLS